MKLEVKKIKHARSLSEETNAFTAELHVDGEHVAVCKNSGQGGMTDVYPKYSQDKTKQEHYREMIKKAEAFCQKLPNLPSEIFKEGLPMSLDFYIDLEIEKDLSQKEVKRVLNKLDKLCLNHIIILSKKNFDDFCAGKTNELKQTFYGWKRPIAAIPVEVIRMQLPAVKAKMKGDEFIYNKNLPQ